VENYSWISMTFVGPGGGAWMGIGWARRAS